MFLWRHSVILCLLHFCGPYIPKKIYRVFLFLVTETMEPLVTEIKASLINSLATWPFHWDLWAIIKYNTCIKWRSFSFDCLRVIIGAFLHGFYLNSRMTCDRWWQKRSRPSQKFQKELRPSFLMQAAPSQHMDFMHWACCQRANTHG